MGIFSTIATGYKLMFHETIFKVRNNSPKLLSGAGMGIMMIGAGLFARTAAKEETREAIASAEAALEATKKELEAVKDQPKDIQKPIRRKYYRAKLKKYGTIVKVYRKPIAVTAGGLGVGVSGIVEGAKQVGALTASVAAVSQEFLDYRYNVISEQGPEADRRYLTSKIYKTKELVKDAGGNTDRDGYISGEEGSLAVDADPSAFRLWFSRESCPSLWEANYDLRRRKLEHIEDELNIKLRTNGHITLNDMRRCFGGLTPMAMDVGIGGILGRVWDPSNPNNPKGGRLVDLGFREDRNFMEGRTDSCWIIFDVDKEPIINKIGKKSKKVETWN